MPNNDFQVIYHEMMAHVPLFLHPNPKKILVIGGNDGGTAREVLRHHSIEKCVRVKAEEALAWTKSAAEKVRTGARDAEKLDVICVDYSNPEQLNDEFYADLKTILAPNGIVISLAESPFYSEKTQESHAHTLKNHFKRVHFYNFTNITAPGGLTSFSFATDNIHPIDDLSRSKVASSGLTFQYYNLGVHEASFLLPEFQKSNLKDYLNPL